MGGDREDGGGGGEEGEGKDEEEVKELVEEDEGVFEVLRLSKRRWIEMRVVYKMVY